MRALTVVATATERDALLGSIPSADVADVVVAGIGPAAAAAATADALATSRYDVVISAGICGAFPGTASIGDIVIATQIVAADLGADSPEGFLSASDLEWTSTCFDVPADLVASVRGKLPAAVAGPVLTVSTVTGTHDRACALANRFRPVAEAMEGWGVVEAARRHDLPVVEVRTVSNVVGIRDKATWDIPLALSALTVVGSALLGQPWD